MINPKEHPSLHARLEESRKTRQEWLDQARKAAELAELLPPEIQRLQVTGIDSSYSGHLSLSVKADKDTVTILKILGIQGLKPRVSSWSGQSFYTSGSGKLSNGDTFDIRVNDITEPEGCVVKETRTWSKTYSLVCAQKSGEEAH